MKLAFFLFFGLIFGQSVWAHPTDADSVASIPHGSYVILKKNINILPGQNLGGNGLCKLMMEKTSVHDRVVWAGTRIYFDFIYASGKLSGLCDRHPDFYPELCEASPPRFRRHDVTLYNANRKSSIAAIQCQYVTMFRYQDEVNGLTTAREPTIGDLNDTLARSEDSSFSKLILARPIPVK